MTSRSRILTAFRLGVPDRVPVSPFISMGWLKQAGELGDAILQQTDPLINVRLGCDPICGVGLDKETREEGSDTVTVIHTPKGDLTQRFRRTEVTSASVECFLKTPEDAERFFSIPYVPPPVDAQWFIEQKEQIGEAGFVLSGMGNAVALPASWYLPQDFCLMWADHPEVIEKLTAVAAERLNEFLPRLIEAGVDAVRVVGGEYVSVQLGPAAFARLVTPHDTELFRRVHAAGGIVYYHNHGKVNAFLEALAALGLDALDPLERPPCGDVDLAEAKRRIGDRVCLVGNFDDMEVIGKVGEAEMRKLAREALAAAGPGGFVLGGTASGLYTERMARNFLVMAEVAAG